MIVGVEGRRQLFVQRAIEGGIAAAAVETPTPKADEVGTRDLGHHAVLQHGRPCSVIVPIRLAAGARRHTRRRGVRRRAAAKGDQRHGRRGRNPGGVHGSSSNDSPELVARVGPRSAGEVERLGDPLDGRGLLRGQLAVGERRLDQLVDHLLPLLRGQPT